MPPTLTIDSLRLTELRSQAGLASDKELADKLHISTATLSRIRNGAPVTGRFIASAYMVLGAELGDNLYQREYHAAAAA